jgi:nicotinate-nucleotide adenylyltransferase
MKIGLLGGSFNPPHAAHLRISLEALRRLGLDQVWWLVSPGNPLKHPPPPAAETRASAAARLVRHPRIKITDFETGLGSAYTCDTIRYLKRRFPDARFVWLMGADNLAQFHRWKDWKSLFGLVPIAVFDRPGFRFKAFAGRAAQAFWRFFIDPSDAAALPLLDPPAWTLLSLPLSPLSSTVLRGRPS